MLLALLWWSEPKFATEFDGLQNLKSTVKFSIQSFIPNVHVLISLVHSGIAGIHACSTVTCNLNKHLFCENNCEFHSIASFFREMTGMYWHRLVKWPAYSNKSLDIRVLESFVVLSKLLQVCCFIKNCCYFFSNNQDNHILLIICPNKEKFEDDPNHFVLDNAFDDGQVYYLFVYISKCADIIYVHVYWMIVMW